MGALRPSEPARGTTVATADDEWRRGWTAGIGVEFAIIGNWPAKLKYNFMDFQKDAITFESLIACTVKLDTTPFEIRRGLPLRRRICRSQVLASARIQHERQSWPSAHFQNRSYHRQSLDDGTINFKARDRHLYGSSVMTRIKTRSDQRIALRALSFRNRLL
jgi:hypothetical protein